MVDKVKNNMKKAFSILCLAWASCLRSILHDKKLAIIDYFLRKLFLSAASTVKRILKIVFIFMFI